MYGLVWCKVRGYRGRLLACTHTYEQMYMLGCLLKTKFLRVASQPACFHCSYSKTHPRILSVSLYSWMVAGLWLAWFLGSGELYIHELGKVTLGSSPPRQTHSTLETGSGAIELSFQWSQALSKPFIKLGSYVSHIYRPLVASIGSVMGLIVSTPPKLCG